MSLKDLDWLVNKKDLVGAEIGVYHGSNAYRLLTRMNIKLLHLVDPYTAYLAKESNKQVTQESMGSAKQAALKRLEGLEDRIKWHFKPSVEAAREVKDRSLDFVYIDGDHAYTEVKKDITSWTPKIKRGGILAGDDYNVKPVRKAVDELLKVSTIRSIEWYTKAS